MAGLLPSSEGETVGSHVVDCVRCQSRLELETDDAVMKRRLEAEPDTGTADAAAEIIDRLVSEMHLPPTEPAPGCETVSSEIVGFAEPEDDIGRIGPFRLLDVLGRGGMGIVYRAWDEPLGRVVAVKVLHPEHAGAVDRLRLVREARLASRFQNDHAVTIHSVVDSPDGLPYLVMEYVQGPTLAELIGSNRCPPPRELAKLAAQVALALGAAHNAGLVHRDVKPSNILIDATTGRAKITDFGVARTLAAPSTITREGVVAGTPAYMSPEQARGDPDLDPRSDVYSLGATLYEGLTGQPPFAGALHAILRRITEEDPIPPRRFDHEIPSDLETICLKAMAKEPKDRYQTAHDLGDDLNRWLRNEPIHARPASRLEQGWRRCRRNPRVSILSTALGIALVFDFLLVVWQWRRAEFQAGRAEFSRQAAESNLNSAHVNLAHARRAVDQFYTRFYEQDVLEVPGLEKVRHEVLGEMLQYYKDFLERNRDDPGLRRELAESCQRLGMITFSQGDKTDGLALLRRAARDFERLLGDSQGVCDLEDRVLVCLNNTGRLEYDAGEHEPARKTYQKSIDLLKVLIARNPADLNNRRRLAAVYGNLAILFGTALGDKANARKWYLHALELQKELVLQDPAELMHKNDLATTYQNLTFDETDPVEIVNLSEQAIAIRKQLMEQEPTNVFYRRNLARSYEIKGLHDLIIGRATEGLRAVKEACRLLREIVAEQPTATTYQANLAQALDNLGTSLAKNGAPHEGRESLAEAVAIYQKLVHANANDQSFQTGLRLAQDNLVTLDQKHNTPRSAVPTHYLIPGSKTSAQKSAGH